MSSSVGKPWPTWVRLLVLGVGLVASAAAGYLVAVASYIVAVILGAAPLGLAGESTPQQPWVTPVAVGAGVLAFCLGSWLTVRTYRRHRGRSVQVSRTRR